MVLCTARLSVVPCDASGHQSLSLWLPLVIDSPPAASHPSTQHSLPLPETLDSGEMGDRSPPVYRLWPPCPLTPVPTTSICLLPGVFCPSSLLGPGVRSPSCRRHSLPSPQTWGSEPLLSLDHQPSQERLSTLGQDPSCSPPPASTSRNFHCPFTPSRSFAQNFILKSVFIILHTSSKLPVFTHARPCCPAHLGAGLLSQLERGVE